MPALAVLIRRRWAARTAGQDRAGEGSRRWSGHAVDARREPGPRGRPPAGPVDGGVTRLRLWTGHRPHTVIPETPTAPTTTAAGPLGAGGGRKYVGDPVSGSAHEKRYESARNAGLWTCQNLSLEAERSPAP